MGWYGPTDVPYRASPGAARRARSGGVTPSKRTPPSFLKFNVHGQEHGDGDCEWRNQLEKPITGVCCRLSTVGDYASLPHAAFGGEFCGVPHGITGAALAGAEIRGFEPNKKQKTVDAGVVA